MQDHGFAGVEAGASGDILRSVDAVALVGGRQRLGAGRLQRLHGIADVEGRGALAFSPTGFTDEATKWAERAEMPLFSLSQRGVAAINASASHLQQAGATPSVLGSLLDCLQQVNHIGRPTSILVPTSIEGREASIDFHFGVNTCHNCGEQPTDARARKCRLCGARLPSNRFPWRVKIEVPASLAEEFVGPDSSCRFYVDAAIDGNSQILSLHRELPSAYLCWVEAATRLGVNLKEAAMLYLGVSIDPGIATRLQELGLVSGG